MNCELYVLITPIVLGHAFFSGDRSLKSPPQSADLEAFHSGFQMCTKEVLRYLSPPERWTSREPRCAQLLGHLHSMCRRFLPGSPLFTPRAQGRCCSPQDGPQQLPPDQRPGGTLKQEPPQPNCVPVIQRTQNWGRGAATHQLPPSGPEQAGEPDTDTDSGYGGEGEGKKTPQGGLRVKREPADVELEVKKVKMAPAIMEAKTPSDQPFPTLLLWHSSNVRIVFVLVA
ncbi:PREDICTED: class E basic helix-loop-helix protein 41-like [Thamnophis sirtalis]|uniref:Class E basic helix-loop-helix protein 41-like n=1 Tax=Thamnophis sirtalis TaxID=35019 RepID=A0A6I9YRB9_9SAUR|nr:PREDICTED: class E basic helix-loop-helix protein 41-like [Thamnophis sirtalis]